MKERTVKNQPLLNNDSSKFLPLRKAQKLSGGHSFKQKDCFGSNTLSGKRFQLAYKFSSLYCLCSLWLERSQVLSLIPCCSDSRKSWGSCFNAVLTNTLRGSGNCCWGFQQRTAVALAVTSTDGPLSLIAHPKSRSSRNQLDSKHSFVFLKQFFGTLSHRSFTKWTYLGQWSRKQLFQSDLSFAH